MTFETPADRLPIPEDTYGHGPVASDGYRCTDTGNSERLIDIAEGHLRYVGAWGKWIVYRGGKWVVDNDGALVTEYAKKVARKLFAHAAKMDDTPERKQMFLWAFRSESTGAIRGMIHQARGNPAVTTEHEQLDAPGHLLNVKNGTIDLRTGTLLAHNPADLLTLQVNVDYDPQAAAPLWEACLQTWQPASEIRDYLQLEAGAGATGHPTETLSVHYGHGGNGKSKAWGAIQHVLGDYACVPHKSLLIAGRNEQHDTIRAALFRKRLGVASETSETATLAEEQVKAITGGDRMSGRKMYENQWEFEPTHTLVIFTNHLPKINGTDESVWRRVRLIPWEVTIPEGERDIELARKLRDEAPGILAWIVAGARRFHASGFEPPAAVKVATSGYRQDEDAVSRFLADAMEFGDSYEVTTTALRDEMEGWCREQAQPEPTIQQLAAAMKNRGLSSRRKTSNSYGEGGRKATVWQGLRVKVG